MDQNNIVMQLRSEAALAGTNLTTICRKAGVTRQTLINWEKKEPTSLQILRRLQTAIENIKQEQRDAETVSVPG